MHVDQDRAARVDAILERIDAAELDRLASALAALLISAAQSGGRRRRVVDRPSDTRASTPDTADVA